MEEIRLLLEQLEQTSHTARRGRRERDELVFTSKRGRRHDRKSSRGSGFATRDRVSKGLERDRSDSKF